MKFYLLLLCIMGLAPMAHADYRIIVRGELENEGIVRNTLQQLPPTPTHTILYVIVAERGTTVGLTLVAFDVENFNQLSKLLQDNQAGDYQKWLKKHPLGHLHYIGSILTPDTPSSIQHAIEELANQLNQE